LEWNRKNRAYFQEIYLDAKLAKVSPPGLDGAKGNSSPTIPLPASRASPPNSPRFPQLPRSLVQEVIGTQHLVIIEYVAQLLFRSFKEVIGVQQFEITAESRRVPFAGGSRGDSPGRGP
jgi:hypothetical protein